MIFLKISGCDPKKLNMLILSWSLFKWRQYDKINKHIVNN